MKDKIPNEVDFVFIDGDHSYDGLQIDWQIISKRVITGGIVSLHDTSVPEAESYRKFGTNQYFEKNIRFQPEFDWLERCYSLNVMRRL